MWQPSHKIRMTDGNLIRLTFLVMVDGDRAYTLDGWMNEHDFPEFETEFFVEHGEVHRTFSYQIGSRHDLFDIEIIETYYDAGVTE